jgi:hypothetical protein
VFSPKIADIKYMSGHKVSGKKTTRSASAPCLSPSPPISISSHRTRPLEVEVTRATHRHRRLRCPLPHPAAATSQATAERGPGRYGAGGISRPITSWCRRQQWLSRRHALTKQSYRSRRCTCRRGEWHRDSIKDSFWRFIW